MHSIIPGSEEYSFCEAVVATGPWHIRKVDGSGRHFRGGVTTPSLCGLIRPFGIAKGCLGGWDLNVKITEHHGKHCCTECWEKFNAELGKKAMLASKANAGNSG